MSIIAKFGNKTAEKQNESRGKPEEVKERNTSANAAPMPEQSKKPTTGYGY